MSAMLDCIFTQNELRVWYAMKPVHFIGGEVSHKNLFPKELSRHSSDGGLVLTTLVL